MKKNINVATENNDEDIFVDDLEDIYDFHDIIKSRKTWTCMDVINGYIPGMTNYTDIPVYVEVDGIVSFVFIGTEARKYREFTAVETSKLHCFLTNELFLYKSRNNEATKLCNMVAELYELSFGKSIDCFTYDKNNDPFIYELDDPYEWDEDRFPDSPDDPGSDEEFEAYCLSRPLPKITPYKEPEDDDLPF